MRDILDEVVTFSLQALMCFFCSGDSVSEATLAASPGAKYSNKCILIPGLHLLSFRSNVVPILQAANFFFCSSLHPLQGPA